MKILITGGAGFVGSSLAIHLKTWLPKSRIVCLDNLSRRGSELNVGRLRSRGVAFKKGDVRREGDIRACGAFDLVIDCAADPAVLSGIQSSPDEITQTNLFGTINTLKIAARHQADFIFLSTSRVYPVELLNRIRTRECADRFVIARNQPLDGVTSKGLDENFPLGDSARSFYGASKLASELFVQEYGRYGQIGRFVINRLSVIAGPWQMGKLDQGVLTLWCARHYFNKPLKYIGWGAQGKQVRDFLHIDDLCELIKLEISHWELCHGITFNAGGGLANSASLKELTRMCRRATGRIIRIGREARVRDADVKLYITDNRKIEKALGWKPKKSLNCLIEDTVRWIRQNEKILKPVFAP